RTPRLSPMLEIESPLAIRPEGVLVAPCAYAPIVTVHSTGNQTAVRALTHDGALRWSTRIEGLYTSAIRADLDNDGVREIYLGGDDALASLDARGNTRFIRPLAGAGSSRSLIALPHRSTPRLVADGFAYDPHGEPLAPIALAYEGDGRRL